MASNTKFLIRCKSENGSFLLDDVTSETTVGELKTKVAQIINKSPGSLRILSGYPPKALKDGSDSMTLGEVSIHSGETIIIQNIPGSVSHASGASLSIKASVKKPAKEMPPEIVIDEKEDNPTMDEQYTLAKDGCIMMRHVVPSNNSCLFTSVHFVLSNCEMKPEKSNELRKVIARAVSDNPEKYNSAFLGMSNKDYCAWIQNTERWGGAIELAILSEHFRIEIVAVDTISLALHRFGETAKYDNRIFLIYDGIHYDPLVLESQNGARLTIFPASDQSPMDMALEIAKEAKSSRQYTDVANFTLKCMKCHVHLRGDTEARAHAIGTGHVEYGEITK